MCFNITYVFYHNLHLIIIQQIWNLLFSFSFFCLHFLIFILLQYGLVFLKYCFLLIKSLNLHLSLLIHHLFANYSKIHLGFRFKNAHRDAVAYNLHLYKAFCHLSCNCSIKAKTHSLFLLRIVFLQNLPLSK